MWNTFGSFQVKDTLFLNVMWSIKQECWNGVSRLSVVCTALSCFHEIFLFLFWENHLDEKLYERHQGGVRLKCIVSDMEESIMVKASAMLLVSTVP